MPDKSLPFLPEDPSFASLPVARAPGRVNLIGEHIDYLGGSVLPAAIDRHLGIRFAPNGTDRVRIMSALDPETVREFGVEDETIRSGEEAWLNYVLGVLAEYRKEGTECPGFDASVSSNIPSGAGLSSSAALEAAVALIVEELTGERRDPVTRARLCQRAEHHFAGVPCGIMDQLAVCASETDHALLIDCETCALEPVPLPDGIALVVADTGVKHALGDGGYRKRREECEAAAEILGVEKLCRVRLEEIETAGGALDPVLARRARHAVTELRRVGDFVKALRSGDRESTLRILRAGHDSLRDDFEVSCPELDRLVDAAYEPPAGLWGARMTGGGFGGSIVALVDRGEAEGLRAHLGDSFEQAFGRRPEIFLAKPSAGAAVV